MRARTRVASALLALASSFPTHAGKAVVLGQTYPIAEPDTLEEIKRQAASKDWQSWMKREPANYGAFASVALPRAQQAESRLFDPTYTLPEDIKDQQGKVLFPKGITVNVYDRIKVPGRYIVIGPEPENFVWLREVAKPVSGDKVLVAGGNVLTLRQTMGVPLYQLDDRFIERFGLRRVPAIVRQEGNKLRINEYALP